MDGNNCTRKAGGSNESPQDGLPQDSGNVHSREREHDQYFALEQALKWLREDNDTSRFAGLALLKSLLDKHTEFHHAKILEKIEEKFPLDFIDRLLKSSVSDLQTDDEAKKRIDIAVSVLHSLICSSQAPTKRYATQMFIRIDLLLSLLPSSSAFARRQTLDILLRLAVDQSGTKALWQSQLFENLINLTLDDLQAKSLLKYIYVTATADDYGKVEERTDETISKLISIASNPGRVYHLFDVVTVLLSREKQPSTLSGALDEKSRKQQESSKAQDDGPHWLNPLTEMLHKTVLYRSKDVPNSVEACLQVGPLATVLLSSYSQAFPPLLFCSTKKEDRLTFISSILIEIRSVLPSMQESIYKADHSILAAQLTASYDVLFNFLRYLIDSLDPVDETMEGAVIPALRDPSNLLRLRRDISEVISLTIEHLRERFDASIAGVKGLHPDSRVRDPSALTSRTPLSLPLEDPTAMERDPLTLAEIRTLAFWVREDENAALRKEAAGLMDLFVYLYRGAYNDLDASASGKDDGFETNSSASRSQDYRTVINLALEGILEIPEGVQTFLSEKGAWQSLTIPIKSAAASSEESRTAAAAAAARVLTLVAEAEVTGPTREEWMDLIPVAASLAKTAAASKKTRLQESVVVVELVISTGQLALTLFERAPSGVRRRCKQSVVELKAAFQALVGKGTVRKEELVEDLGDILQGLDNMV